jgi:hypothetical protein
VDASQLKQAAGDFQPRDRANRAASETQIESIKGNLDAERLHSSPEADRGAPIVSPDDTIESGHARVEAIRRAYAQQLPQADAYRAMIERRGHAIPEGVQHPVLIRRRTTAMDDATRRQFVQEANTPATMSMSAPEQAKADATALTPEILTQLRPAKEGVLAAGNRGFVMSWLSRLSEGERNKLVTDDGGLSREGAQRLHAAITARAYGDPAVLNRMLESPSKELAPTLGALQDAAPAMAKLRAEVEAGRIPADLDISKALMRAVDLTRVAREKGQSPQDILTAGDMFDPIDRTTAAAVRVFHDPKMTRLAGRARVADVLNRYAQEALKQTTGDLAGGTKLDPAQYLNAAMNKAATETESQGGLFGPQAEPGGSNSIPPATAGAEEGSGPSRSSVATPAEGAAPSPPGATEPTPAPTPEPAANPEAAARAAQIKKLKATIAKDRERLEQVRQHFPNDPAIAKLAPQLARKEAQLAKLEASTPEKSGENPGVAAAAELAPPGFDPTVRGNVSRNTQHTMRPSRYMRQVAEEAGVADPDAFVSLPAPVQTRRLSHALTRKYGLGTITIHPGSNPRLILDQLADAHHNLQSMASVMAVPNEAIGFGGELNLWLGPTSAAEVQGALGVYVPATRTIYMPGRSNSFAHEWTHALDDELVRRLSASPRVGELLSTHYPGALTGATQGPLAAFGNLIGTIFGGTNARAALNYLQATRQALRAPTPANQRILAAARQAFHASDFYRRAVSAGGPRGTYLSQPFELLARSHEAYFSNRIGRAGGDTEFVAKPEAAYLHEADRDLRAMYPHGDERNAIFDAWDRVHRELRLGALYPNGIPADMAPRNDLFGLGPNHWGQWASPAANPQLAAALRASVHQQVNQLGAFSEGLRRIGVNPADGADPGYLTAWMRHTDAFRAATYSPRGMLNVIHARVPPAAQPPLRELIDHLTTDPGSGRLVRQTWEEEVHATTRSDHNDYAAIAQKRGVVTLTNWRQAPRMTQAEHNMVHELLTQATSLDGLPERIREAIRRHTINRLSPADQRTLRDHWDTHTGATVPDNLRRFATDLRFVLDRKYYELNQAGLQIPYMDGYFPRVYDDHRIWADRDGFRQAATEANIIRSERTIGDDGNALVDQFRQVRDRLDPQDAEDINTGVAAARRALQPGQRATPEDLVPDRDHRDAIHRAWAEQQAEHWLEQVLVGGPTSYDTRGPTGAHLRERVMPPEADAILRPWLVTDPHAAIPAYLSQVNRKIAFAKRFGPTGRRIDELVADAVHGGMHPEDRAEVRRLVDMITGRQGTGRQSKATNRLLEGIHAYGTMALMPRAAFSALSEPMAVLARTGSARATYAGFAHQVSEIFRSGDAQRIAEIANYVGTVTSAMFESVQQHRTGANYTDSQSLGPMMVNYFRRTGLTAVTNSQRRAALVSFNYYLRILARNLGEGPNARRDAQRELRDLGIPDEEHDDFARWFQGTGHDPDIADLEGTQNGDRWKSGVVRFTDQVNQDPKTSEKAMRSSDPTGRLIFGLMSFNYGFYANVIERFFKSTHERFSETPGAGRKAAVLASAIALGGASVAAAWFGQFVSSVLREKGTNGTTWDEHEKAGDLMGWLAELSFQRIGLNGPLDPVVQAINGLKYNKSVADLALGAQAGWVADNVQSILEAVVRSSPHTNTSYYNGLKAAYSLLAVPAAAAALTAIPGGRVVSGLATGAMMKLTSRSAADTFATAIVGPKGSGDKTTAPETDVDPPERESEDEDKDNKAGRGMGNQAIGLVDDFLPLIARQVSRIPRKGLIGAGVLGGAYVLDKLAKEAGRFTEPPPGKPAR